MLIRHSAVAVLVLMGSVGIMRAQAQPRVLTAEDYARAERWMNYNVNGLVEHTIGGVQFLPDGRVFYIDPGANGMVYMLADPAHGTVAPAFDNGRLTAALRAATNLAFEARHLWIGSYTPDAHGFTVLTAAGEFHCDPAVSRCEKAAGLHAPPVLPQPQTKAQLAAAKSHGPFDVSPDGKYAAFIRSDNLWVRVNATGEEKQLTTDGVKDFGYATDNAGWTRSDAPIVVWSPDSKKIATFQQDQRQTGSMYLVPVTNRHPGLVEWKYPLLGDANVTMIERVVIDVESAKMTRLKMPPDQHRSTLCDDVSCAGGSGWDDVQFAPDGKHVAFVSSSRDHKDAWLRVADTTTGDVREVHHEHVATYYESGQGKVNWHYLPDSNEFLWYSERDNWGQLYLYDLTTDKLKNKVTHGEGPVTEVLNVDEKNRVLYFIADGKEKGEDPYFSHYYRVDFDGRHQQLLTPETANHEIVPSRDGNTFVDVYSTAQTPKTAVIRDDRGKVLVTLAHQDISQLLAAGWKPPVSIKVSARDGKTPLYGLMWKPTNFDAEKKYPLVDYVYPGPYTGSCPTRSFATAQLDNQALADLGFIVVCIDGMGTPWRSKSFHDVSAGVAMVADNTLPDQVSGIKDLGSQFSWIDLNRVGIWGHSGGGNAAAAAMFHFPDFFKVGIAESGNHDNREYEDDWDEKWGGLEKIAPDGTSNYDSQANQNFAKNLKGRLLLAYGTMDDNVPPNNTLLVVDALIKANKDFDLVVFPNAKHHYDEGNPYMMRRRWDYFVRYLAGDVPPANYEMKPWDETQRLLSESGPQD